MSNTLIETAKRYNELRPQIGKQTAPRLGFYLIKEVFRDPKYTMLYRAKALWKENEGDPFFTRLIHDIQLTAFVMTQPKPEKFNPEVMAGRVVKVTDSSNSEFEVSGKMYPTVACQWHFNDDPYLLNDSKPGFLDILEEVSLTEAVNSAAQSMGCEIAEALRLYENEEIDKCFEDPMEDENPNDAPDAEDCTGDFIDFNGNDDGDGINDYFGENGDDDDPIEV